VRSCEPHWLKVLLMAAESNPGLDVLGGKLVNAADPTLPNRCRGLPRERSGIAHGAPVEEGHRVCHQTPILFATFLHS
jgi:hypothetical protein